MKKKILLAMLFFACFCVCYSEQGKLSYKIFGDSSGKGKVDIFNSTGILIQTISVSSKQNILFENDKTLYIISTEPLTERENDKKINNLKHLYKVDLLSSTIKIIDYITTNAVISQDGRYVLFSYYYRETAMDHLQLKLIGDPDTIWDISAACFNGVNHKDDFFTDFVINKTGKNECLITVINQTYENIEYKFSFSVGHLMLVKK